MTRTSRGWWPRRERESLLPFADVLAALGDDGAMGTTEEEIDLAAVVGSVARAEDYDADFRPRGAARDVRLHQVRSRFAAGTSPPPVELVRLGELFFVVDGHHRVAVARELGWDSLPARVRRICTVAFARCCLRLADLDTSSAERRFLEQLPLPDDVREQLRLDRPADWARLADAAQSWGYRRQRDGVTYCCAHDLASAWWRAEVEPVVARLGAREGGCDLSVVQRYAAALAERDRLGALSWDDDPVVGVPDECCGPPAPRPFTLAVPDAELDELRWRLDHTRWPDERFDAGWTYGIPVAEVRELADHWRTGYDWRAAEAELNAWPQYLTEIDGTQIHYAHVRSPEPDATPLLMSHGWPGSIVEFLDIAPLLTDPGAHGGDPREAFHLVLPSLPGFGFSGPTPEPGWEVRRIALAFDELMRRLDYDRYLAHGGDWGSAVSRELGRVRPDRVAGVHLTLVPGSAMTTDPDAPGGPDLDPDELERARRSWRRLQRWEQERAGYAALQATRPQTLAYALTDSPVGQLAWIAERFAEWSDTRAGATPIGRDRLLTNVMVYWLTRTAGSSARLYFEREHAGHHGVPDPPSTAPTAFADFPEENFVVMRHVVERTNTIVRWTTFEHGGHFAALEQPEALAADLRAFAHSLRPGE